MGSESPNSQNASLEAAEQQEGPWEAGGSGGPRVGVGERLPGCSLLTPNTEPTHCLAVTRGPLHASGKVKFLSHRPLLQVSQVLSVPCIRQKRGGRGEVQGVGGVSLLQTLTQLVPSPFKTSAPETRWLLALPLEGLGSLSFVPPQSIDYLSGDVLKDNTGDHGWEGLEAEAKRGSDILPCPTPTLHGLTLSPGHPGVTAQPPSAPHSPPCLSCTERRLPWS